MGNLDKPIIIRTDLNKQLSEDINKYKILYISTPTGWGKTVAINDWLKESGQSFSFLNVKNQDEFIKELKKVAVNKNRHHIIVIDDFHNVYIHSIRKQIVEYISSTPISCHFILLSRAEVSTEFKPFIITRQLKSYGAESFKFTMEDCKTFLETNEIIPNNDILNYAFYNCQGYAISLNSLVLNLKRNNEKFDESIKNRVVKDLFDYYDITLFKKWTDEMQEFLISIAGFDEFTPLLAQMVTLKANIKDIIERCYITGSFLIFYPPDTYKIHSFFRKYLLYKQKELLDEKSLKSIYNLAGNYYQMIGNHTPNALKYYNAAGENDKIINILMKESTFGAGKGKFIELEPYYMLLKEEDILKSPMLCSAMAMLHSLSGRINESEHWFNKLIEMKKTFSPKTNEYTIVEEQIAYLSIALPHTGATGIAKKLGVIAKQFAKNSFHMQDIAITGNMPSLMHGGKDFCNWSKNAEPLRKMLKGFVEFIFITDGIGLADTGVGEAYYEQNKLDSALIELTKGTTDSRNKGSVEMLFAGTAVLVKLLVAKGEYESALSMAEGMKDAIVQKGSTHLLPNYDAFMVHLNLLTGNINYAKEWFKTQAPDENLNFYTTERYRYITKVRIYITDKKYTQAEILLERLKKYFKEYKRTFDYMEATLLQSIIYFRKNNYRWHELLNEVLSMAESYQFIRIIADEGEAVYPLLIKLRDENLSKTKTAYLNKVIINTNKQAILYPNYLKDKNTEKTYLTKTELTILKLLICGKKYCEIKEIMGVSLNTVKFHVKNIYHKLNVSDKARAIAKAKSLKIV